MIRNVKDRLILLGEVYANDKPVMMALEVNPSTRSGNSNYVDVTKIASAYTRSNTQNMLNNSNIRYINENESRVNEWLKVNRLHLPLPNSHSDSANNSISDSHEKVNSDTKFSYKSPAESDEHISENMSVSDIDSNGEIGYNYSRKLKSRTQIENILLLLKRK